VKKTNAVEEFIKKEQSKAENEEDFEGDYECPILKDKARKKLEIQKELKALTKELRPKKKKERMEEMEEEKEEEEEKGEPKEMNDVLESYHKEKKRYAEVKAAKPIPKQKASREEQTLALLAKFKQKLSGIKYGEDEEEKDAAKETKKDDNDKTEEDKEKEDEEIVGDDWMKNTLVFEDNAPVLAKDASSKDDDWFDIYDPRNPINKRRRENDAQDGAKREKDRMRRVI